MVKLIILIKKIKYLCFLIITYFTLTVFTVIIAGQLSLIAFATVCVTVPLAPKTYTI